MLNVITGTQPFTNGTPVHWMPAVYYPCSRHWWCICEHAVTPFHKPYLLVERTKEVKQYIIQNRKHDARHHAEQHRKEQGAPVWESGPKTVSDEDSPQRIKRKGRWRWRMWAVEGFDKTPGSTDLSLREQQNLQKKKLNISLSLSLHSPLSLFL